MNNSWPQHSSDELKTVKKILKSGMTNYLVGNEGKLFEKEFAKFSNSKYAIAVSNGTVALDLALKSLKLSEKSEIIVTPRSFVASASCILLNKLKPVFVDVDILSQNISVDSIKKAISIKTKAIICVHLGGLPCDMIEIMKIAKKNNLFVIEDCSQAHGARINKKSVGSFGHISTWSFCNDKIISTGGEGGMITTNNKKLNDFCWSYKDHGKNFKKFLKAKNNNDGKFKFLHDNYGSNYRLTEIQSSLGRIQLRNLKKNSKKRNIFCNKIKNKFIKSKIIKFQDTNFIYEHAYYKLYIIIDKNFLRKKINNINFINYLLSQKISCGVGSCSEIYGEKMFKNIKVNKNLFLNNIYLSYYSFCINVNHFMNANYANHVVNTLKFLERKFAK
jgi:dTDP-4-amino-4,6-dideoxygalactose transaminase